MHTVDITSINNKLSTPDKKLYARLLDSIDTEAKGCISKVQLLKALEEAGIQLDDPRIQKSLERLKGFSKKDPIHLIDFYDIIHSNVTIYEKCLTGKLIIPSFQAFSEDIKEIFEKTKGCTEGAVADYIPQLKRVNPEHYAVSICTIDGQRLSIGDAQTPFCLQSTCKPINYCFALEEHGEDYVHKHVGREPSGTVFNELALNSQGLPHNPMINSGAIMCCSLLQQKMDISDKFDYVLSKWASLSGGKKPGFNNAVYLSEKQTADRNFALGYFMRENNGFPEGIDLIETLEFYFQCCSIELTCDDMAMVAATLANSGTCPTTRENIFQSSTVKNCLSLMSSCGMYDFSGEYAFLVGLPAKSGVSGGIMVVVPNVLGLAIWSPRLDKVGNSVRGQAFCHELIKKFNFHNYDNLHGVSNKKDPRLSYNQAKYDKTVTLCWAASFGDLGEIKQLFAQGFDLNSADYDQRTAMHLAASEGHIDVMKYLILKGVKVNPVDRWGSTPLDDALRSKNQAAVDLLKRNGGLSAKKLA